MELVKSLKVKGLRFCGGGVWRRGGLGWALKGIGCFLFDRQNRRNAAFRLPIVIYSLSNLKRYTDGYVWIDASFVRPKSFTNEPIKFDRRCIFANLSMFLSVSVKS